jgi:hypothetical protein
MRTHLLAIFSLMAPLIGVAQAQSQSATVAPNAATGTDTAEISKPPPFSATRNRFLVTVSAESNPEHFPPESVAATLFSIVEKMEAKQSGDAIEFLTRDVKLPPDAARRVVESVRSSVTAKGRDDRAELADVCDAARRLETPQALAARLREFTAQETGMSWQDAKQKFEQFDAATRATLQNWMDKSLRPTLRRTEIDYEKWLEQPGAMEEMRTQLCRAAENAAVKP